jgi:hypothetical protein
VLNSGVSASEEVKNDEKVAGNGVSTTEKGETRMEWCF